MTIHTYRIHMLGALFLVLSGAFSTPAYSSDQAQLEKAEKISAQAINLYKSNRFAEALPLFEEAHRLGIETLGERHPDTLDSLGILALTHKKLGQNTEALSLLEKMLRLRTEVLGEQHPDTLATLKVLATTHLEIGHHAEALPLVETIVRLNTNVLGEKHPETLRSLGILAETYRKLGRTSEALLLFEKVLRRDTEVFGEQHQETLITLNNFATAHNDVGRHAEALPLFEKLVQISTNALGAQHPNTLTGLSNLASTYGKLGRYKDAQIVDQKVFLLRKEILGERHPDTLNSLNNLAETHRNLGRYAEALALHQKVFQLRKEILGERHPDTLNSLHNLAEAHRNLGRYAEALALYERVFRLRSEVLGERHPDTLTSLSNLALTYNDLGRYAEALTLHEKSYQHRKTVLRELHTDTLGSLNNLAMTYNNLGRNAQALQLHKEVHRLAAKIFGGEHPNTLTSLSNLAETYGSLGKHTEALTLQKNAYQIRVRTSGERHPATLLSLSNLAIKYDELGRHAEALSLNEKALRIRKETLGEQHSDTLVSLLNFSLSHIRLGRETEAVPLLRQLIQGVEALRVNGDLSPENRQALFARWIAAYKTYAMLTLRQNQPKDAFRISELSKARTLLESAALRNANESGVLPPEEQEKARSYDLHISTLSEKIAASSNQPEQRLELEAEKNQAIRDYADYRRHLATKYQKYAELSDVRIVTEEEGRDYLPSDSVFISFLLVGDFPIVFLLDQEGNLKAKALEKTIGLDQTIEAYRKLLSDPTGTSGLADDNMAVVQMPNRTFVIQPAKGRKPNAKPVKDIAEIGRYLAEKLIQPLLPEIAGKRHWIISPDGALSMLPFETLPLNDDYVIAKHDISYTQSLSMLALLKKREINNGEPADRKLLLAMGGAQYQVGNDDIPARGHRTIKRRSDGAQSDTLATLTRNRVAIADTARAFDLMGIQWLNLPGSATEVSKVAAIFAKSDPSFLASVTDILNKVDSRIVGKVTSLLGIEVTSHTTVFKGEHATEEKLLELNRSGELAKYKYLLFSAHGYLNTEEPALSALVLGQVNKAPGTDGYVTASEWPAYDLKSDLIVLSACDTGVGKVVQGEGVMGLPYALYVAGNKNTVLSLWPVVDESTAEFMTSFFGKLKAGVPQVKALNDTKREFLNGKKFDKPAFWAPFVMYGI